MSAMTVLTMASMAVKILKVAGLVLALLVLVVLVFLVWAAAGDRDRRQWAKYPVEGPGADRAGATGDTPTTLTVLGFNIAYGRGPRDDAGDLRSRDQVVGYLDAIADAIVRSGADIAALQEVDFDAHRTHGIDQLDYLAKSLGWPYRARVTTWRCNYVPYPYWPPSQHYGRMHSGQAVLSRFPITGNWRWRHPQPESQPFWYRAFYLHRTTQIVDIEVGKRTVRLFNVHLEAFDGPNRMVQARQLVDLVDKKARRYAVVVGDFNTVPDWATRRHGFADEPEADFRTDRTLDIVRQIGFSEVLDGLDRATRERETFTFPADDATRRLDYLFWSSAFEQVEGGVFHDAGAISDHLPLRAVLRLRPQ